MYFPYFIRTTYTRNVGLSRFMVAVEKVKYIPDPNNPNETIAYKEAWVESGLYGLRYLLHNLKNARLLKEFFYV